MKTHQCLMPPVVRVCLITIGIGFQPAHLMSGTIG